MFINNRQHLCQRETFQSDYTVIINTSQADQFDEAAGAFDADLRGDNFFSDFLFPAAAATARSCSRTFPAFSPCSRTRSTATPTETSHF
jgi:hypothetical protein